MGRKSYHGIRFNGQILPPTSTSGHIIILKMSCLPYYWYQRVWHGEATSSKSWALNLFAGSDLIFDASSNA